MAVGWTGCSACAAFSGGRETAARPSGAIGGGIARRTSVGAARTACAASAVRSAAGAVAAAGAWGCAATGAGCLWGWDWGAAGAGAAAGRGRAARPSATATGAGADGRTSGAAAAACAGGATATGSARRRVGAASPDAASPFSRGIAAARLICDFEQDVVRAADHDQVLDIVPPDENELPLSVKAESVDQTEPGLSRPASGYTQTMGEDDAINDRQRHQHGDSASRQHGIL